MVAARGGSASRPYHRGMHGLVLTAAGSSTRFGGTLSKVLQDLAGKPVIAHALDTFRAAIPDLAVVITAQERDHEAMRAVAGGAQIVAGGATRQDSVAAGLAALPDDVEIILVHDAARPLVRIPDVQHVLQAAQTHGAAIAASPLTDSIHGAASPATEDGTRALDAPLDRAGMLAAQTPQAARAELLRRAFQQAAADGFVGTDEAGLLHHAGIPVVACPFLPTNLKITTPLDLAVARRILANED